MWMNNAIYLVISFLFSLLLFSTAVNASVQGWGKVNMQGAIIDSACAIAVESREQTIDMETLPLSDIIRDGQGHSKNFSIRLNNCVLERPGKKNWKHFQVTFDGEADGRLFGVMGEASGVALQITNPNGVVAVPGEALPIGDISPGDMQLDYTMKLVANNHALKAGDYFSLIKFRLDYF
ncbi:fimbrial protein [Serratia sp. IR-2025]|uniref:fimbrial protein n=1 Tax=Serratia marcescens TaxID=615 RepID=UPI0038795D91